MYFAQRRMSVDSKKEPGVWKLAGEKHSVTCVWRPESEFNFDDFAFFKGFLYLSHKDARGNELWRVKPEG